MDPNIKKKNDCSGAIQLIMPYILIIAFLLHPPQGAKLYNKRPKQTNLSHIHIARALALLVCSISLYVLHFIFAVGVVPFRSPICAKMNHAYRVSIIITFAACILFLSSFYLFHCVFIIDFQLKHPLSSP